MKKLWWLGVCVLRILFFTACTPHTPVTLSDITSPLTSPLSYQAGHHSNNGRSLTAMEALPLARSQARAWDSRAILISIQPSREMQANLGLPTDKLGWFYQFQIPETKDELFVHIVDDQVYGTTIAHPMGEPPSFTFQAIDIKQIVLDSNDVVDIYLKSSDGKKYTQNHQNVEWDFRLVFLSTTPNPVWTLYDSKYPGIILVNLDAVTGQTVRDPFP